MKLKNLNNLIYYNRYNWETDQFEKIKVFNVPIPPLWASAKSFKSQWSKLKSFFNFASTSDSFPSHEWPIDECIRWIFTQRYFVKFINDPQNLVLVVRGDGIPLGSKQASFLTMTFLNFGELSKCPSFNFIVNVAEV
jgi:hypothetical protein